MSPRLPRPHGILRRPAALAAGLLLLGMLAGCHRAAPPAAGPQPWKLAFQTEPPDPLYGQDTRFTLRVSDPQGKPATGLDARVELEMTGMAMSTPPVALAPTAAPGVYSGLGRFPMAGDWECRVAVAQGTARQQQVVHYKVD